MDKLKDMKREIKFRAWNIKQQKMFGWDVMSEAKEEGIWIWFNANKDQQENILMQYTGLKDKNGIYIYEGDIIRKVPPEWISKDDSDPRTLDEYLISIANIGLVEYSTDRFILTNRGYQDKIYDGYGHGFIEIIGNVYENPELLK